MQLSRRLNWLRTHPWRALGIALLSSILLLDLLFPPPLPKATAGLVVVARDGSPLRGWPDTDGVWRFPVSATEVSPLYLEALLTYEDRWFYYHPGINPAALLRAVWHRLRYGRIISGGSTLTMQVVRALEPVPHTPLGKLRQMARALQLEARLSKAEILQYYLNHAPMGGIVEGVEMASRSYLGKPAKQLSAAEAALLVVLPQAPSRWRPDRHPERAQAARDKVLRRMASLGRWSAAEVDDALIEKVGARPPRLSWLAPLAAERLHQAARRQTRHAPAVIQSTLARDIQANLEHILADRVGQLPRFVSMAALVIDSESLEVLGYAGSADFQDSRRFNHVDMVRGVRSPGSTLKPFLYAMALDEGLIHSESLLADTPQSFNGYDPGNFQANFSGPVSVSDALQRSLNVPAVDLLDRIGPHRFAAHLQAGGIRLRLPSGGTPNLSLILGGAGTTLEELVGGYRALAANGLAGKPRITASAPREEQRLMSPGAAYIIRQLLTAGGHPEQPFVTPGGPQLAWKTGTSYGFRDAWAVGVSGRYTLGVWIGRPDGTPNPGFFGANVAAPLLHQIAATLNPETPRAQTRPDEVSIREICWPLGLAANDTPPALCHQRRSAWILRQTVPPTLPDRLRSQGLQETAWFTASGQRSHPRCHSQSPSDTAAPALTPRPIAHWPTLLEAWLTPTQRQQFGLTPPSEACARANQSGNALRIIGIHPNTRLRPTPGASQVSLTLTANGGRPPLYWLLDGQQQGHNTQATCATFHLSQSGTHHITVMDNSGHFDSVSFAVESK